MTTTFTTSSDLREPDLTDRLIESISAFHALMDIPITYFDSTGNIRLEWGEEFKVCNLSRQYGNPLSPCGKNLISSINYAAQLGEPYIFVCRGGLIKIATALTHNNTLVGGFIAGPIVMGSIRESNITKIMKEDDIKDEAFPKLAISVEKMKVISPKVVSYISLIFNNCILASVENASEYLNKNEHYQKQAVLNSQVRKYKVRHKDMQYPHDLESEVSHMVNSGNAEEITDVAIKFIDEIYLLEVGDLDAVKMNISSLINLLIRGLPDWDQAQFEYGTTESGGLSALTKEIDYERIKRSACAILRDLAARYADSFYQGSSQLVKDTVEYINRHFKEKLKLSDIAAIFHVNQSYLSTLLKQELGKSFTDYLTGIRLGEAKRLLMESSLNLTQIAYRCGFEDQSYFSKVFRRVEGIAPKDYRTLAFSSASRIV